MTIVVRDGGAPLAPPTVAASVRDALAAARHQAMRTVLLSVEGDPVRTDALDTMGRALDAADVVYADEDWLTAEGTRTRPFHKPCWSPDRLRSQPYLSGVVGYRMQSLHDIDVDPSLSADEQLYALALSVTDETSNVAHLPAIACHRRIPGRLSVGVLPYVQRSFARAGMMVRTTIEADTGLVTWQPAAGDPPPASIIIPTGLGRRVIGGRELVLVENALHSVLENSSAGRLSRSSYEIVVVVDRTTDLEVARSLAALDPSRVKIVRDDRPFNFAAAVNLGADNATGEVLILLNDDTEVITPDWIERLTTLATARGVGAVGVRLDYGDGRIQHAGVTGRHGMADHRYRGYPGATTGYGDELRLTHNVLAVTAACLAVSRPNWDTMGGLDEDFPLNYNDLDLCLRLQEAGLRTVQDNRTVLRHLESSSRTSGSEPWEDALLRSRWEDRLRDDPYDSPCLLLHRFASIAPPPALNRLRELTEDSPPVRFAPGHQPLRCLS